MKRKLLAALCVTAMSAGLLAGCGSSDKTEESTKTEETAKEETSSQEETETKAASSDSDNVASEEEAEKAGFSDGSDEKSDSADTDSENKDSSDSSTTSVLLDTSKELTGIHHAEIEVKDYGTIDVELDADTAPITVTNSPFSSVRSTPSRATFSFIVPGLNTFRIFSIFNISLIGYSPLVAFFLFFRYGIARKIATTIAENSFRSSDGNFSHKMMLSTR